MSHTVTEFVYLRLKPDVKPEDPGNHDGEQFLKALAATKQQSGYQGSSWGRSVEDENNVVWVVDWADARGAGRIDNLRPYLDPSTEAIIFYTTLNPPISQTDTLTKNPVTELVALAFPTSIKPDEHKKLNADLIAFRAALFDKTPDNAKPKSWSMGQVDRPGTIQHPNSPSGQAFVQILAVGWESVEAHKTARETQAFAETIAPLRERMLPPPKGMEMKHVKLTKI